MILAHFRDNASGGSVSVKGLHINIQDVEWRPPQTMLARKMLNEAVANAPEADSQKTIRVSADLVIDIPEPVPWFDQWRETFFTVQFPADHEYTRHFIACLIVVASSDPNPLESAQQLTQKVHMMQNVTPPKLPKWFSQEVLNCYVMLHDGASGDLGRTQQGFDALKSAFGEHKCFLLQINSSASAQKDSVDLWKRFLRRNQHTEHEEPLNAAKSPVEGLAPSSFVPAAPPLIPANINIEVDSSAPSPPPPEVIVAHPLSPMTETGHDMLTTMTSSTESIASSLPKSSGGGGGGSDDESHGWYLTPTDLDNLRHFIQDFTIRALIPFVEKIVGTLNEAIANKKGVSRSLLSATKRWFVTNKPVTGMGAQNTVVYAPDSTEIQTRKLGDLYFMFGNYNLAFQAYHQAKNDFKADSAWQFYAGRGIRLNSS